MNSDVREAFVRVLFNAARHDRIGVRTVRPRLAPALSFLGFPAETLCCSPPLTTTSTESSNEAPELGPILGQLISAVLWLPRQPFATLRQKFPVGQVQIGSSVAGTRPELEATICKCLMESPNAEAEMGLLLGQILGIPNTAA